MSDDPDHLGRDAKAAAQSRQGRGPSASDLRVRSTPKPRYTGANGPSIVPYFDPEFIGLTAADQLKHRSRGDQKKTRRRRDHQPTSDGNYTVDHSGAIFVLRPDAPHRHPDRVPSAWRPYKAISAYRSRPRHLSRAHAFDRGEREARAAEPARIPVRARAGAAAFAAGCLFGFSTCCRSMDSPGWYWRRPEIRAQRWFLSARPFAAFFGSTAVDMSGSRRAIPTAMRSFNEFFTRALKNGARVIADGHDAIACPADGCISEAGTIDGDRLIQAKGRRYRLTAPSLLAAHPWASRFEGGLLPRPSISALLQSPPRAYADSPAANCAKPSTFPAACSASMP